MSKRKWENSNIPITSISSVMNSLELYGGVYIWKFMNKAWVMSQQLHTLMAFIARKNIYYPKRIADNG